ncbi:hypothetical protein IKG07_00080 [Candidatus Saccharibacteria bacterium]|nr:hypothetical protein [Candidatus Saccharibacteria bacterium]
MARIKIIPGVSLVLVFSILGVIFALGDAAYAGQFYPGGYDRCIANSGGRGHLPSIQYACQKASYRNQNACASWLGSASDSVSTEVWITVPKGAATAPLSLYGMCTDRTDTSSAMRIEEDGGSISGYDNFTRGAPWGNVTTKSATLDIARFKAVAEKIQRGNAIIYHKKVKVVRTHSDGASTDYDWTDIYLIEEEEEIIHGPLCEVWMPNSYRYSNENYGRTSIVVKVRNTSGRFGNTMSGAWHHDNPEGNDNGNPDFIGPIYAMPTDFIEWHSCYYPGVQATAFTDVSDINGTFVNGGAENSWSYEPYRSLVYEDQCMGYSPTVGYMQLYKGYERYIGKWENKYEVGADLGGAAGGDYGPGKYTWQADFEREGGRGMGTTKRSDTGNILTQNAWTGSPKEAEIEEDLPEHVIYDWVDHYDYPCGPNGTGPHTCHDPNGPGPGGAYWDPICTNRFSNAIKPASVDGGIARDKARVIIPYNFKNTTGVEIAHNDIYSGEYGITVNRAWVTVGTKYNSLTIADYATVVPYADVALFAYVTDQSDGGGADAISGMAGCDMIDAKQCVEIMRVSMKDLNAGGNLGGSTEDVPGMAGTYNIFDAAAGDYMCFVTAVTPYTSGADDVTGDSAGDGMWKYGMPDCQIISKKPTFQVWGDSLYSVGNVNAYVGAKRNLYSSYFSGKSNLCGSVCFAITGGGSIATINFGSWVEESVILRDGLTSTVASGAATGLNTNYAGAGTTGEFCRARSPLSFANNCSSTNTVGASKINSEMIQNPQKRQELINYWIGSGTDKGSCGSVWGGTCRKLESANNKNIYYVSGGNLFVSGNIPQNTTYLVKASGSVTINGDLRYNNGAYDHIGAIPKVIIYAQNFYIGCNVNEVDAILITAPGGHTDTCSGGGDVSNPARSNQLKVFGTVMTDYLTLGRTFGSAANQGGRTDQFGVPADGSAAEIFDYDSTMLMWGEFMSGSGESDTLNTTYQHELAPRY